MSEFYYGFEGSSPVVVDDWEQEADAQHHIPILTEDEELIWSGLGSMTAYLAAECGEADDDS